MAKPHYKGIGKTKLLQALIPLSTAKHVMAAAKHEGISTGSFIRRMLMEWERTSVRTEGSLCSRCKVPVAPGYNQCAQCADGARP